MPNVIKREELVELAGELDRLARLLVRTCDGDRLRLDSDLGYLADKCAKRSTTLAHLLNQSDLTVVEPPEPRDEPVEPDDHPDVPPEGG